MKYLIILLCLFMLASCNTIWDESFTAPDPDADAEGFYTATSGSFVLKYKVINDNELHCKLYANTQGWLAVGFAPSAMMKDANVIIGYVAGNDGFIRDDFGTSNTTHEDDLVLGGSADIELISATESSGTTMLEFRLPLESGDEKDRILQRGNSYQIIFAAGTEDDFESYHSQIALSSISLR